MCSYHYHFRKDDCMKQQDTVLVTVDRKRFGSGADYCKPDFTDKTISLQKLCTGGSASLPHSYNILNESEIMVKLDPIDSLHNVVINESNCAHHLSYFLIRKAYRALIESKRADERSRILVINFDQHEDFGNNTDVFFCGNWGSRIFEEKGFDFMSVGCCEGERVYARIRRHNSVSEDIGLDHSEDFYKIYARYDKIYVSVDMDVLTGSYKCLRTNRTNGELTANRLRTLLRQIPTHKVFAADITGLPPVGEKTVNRRANIDDVEAYLFDVKTASDILLGKLHSN